MFNPRVEHGCEAEEEGGAKLIIGFCGKLQSGKSTVATHLVKAHNFIRVRFAGPLKDMVKALGLTEEEYDGSRKEEPCELLGGKTPRWAMQSLGTEWGRDLIDPQLWVRAWQKRVDSICLQNPSASIVTDDVRFPNEAAAIRLVGGRLIYIERNQDLLQADGTLHPSERFAFTPDSVLHNFGTIEDLFKKVRQELGLVSA